ncbi:hypothetical protein TAGGR_1439 [Thermodesulfovibrio aggregans]|uniref:DUF5320 domain-containing protein n=1 Tax=Thermodesulfovibrio aggregans TaxID=86166 RepID=A0A0U9HN13_9BACT|nr:DUF5320 domain-containing protein [Thermodesulfovibrio aggregans]GAQ94260.1 hypothetical protein TAGGR_1439 [Thermodesulfovibrio aggregans]
MPWGDRTGPLGQGPRTGRGLGFCSGFATPGYMNPAPGRGFGRGRGWRCFGWFGGFGRGFRFRWFWRAPFFGGISSREEVDLLRQEAEILRSELEAVQKRLSELEKGEAR